MKLIKTQHGYINQHNKKKRKKGEGKQFEIVFHSKSTFFRDFPRNVERLQFGCGSNMTPRYSMILDDSH